MTATDGTVLSANRSSYAVRSGFPSMWFRFDLPKPEVIKGRHIASYRTQLDLYAVDCLKGQTEILQTTLYEGPAMTGDTTEGGATYFTYPIPGTLAEKILKTLCGSP